MPKLLDNPKFILTQIQLIPLDSSNPPLMNCSKSFPHNISWSTFSH